MYPAHSHGFLPEVSSQNFVQLFDFFFFILNSFLLAVLLEHQVKRGSSESPAAQQWTPSTSAPFTSAWAHPLASRVTEMQTSVARGGVVSCAAEDGVFLRP